MRDTGRRGHVLAGRIEECYQAVAALVPPEGVGLGRRKSGSTAHADSPRERAQGKFPGAGANGLAEIRAGGIGGEGTHGTWAGGGAATGHPDSERDRGSLVDWGGGDEGVS